MVMEGLRVSPMATWGESFPGRGNSKSKGLGNKCAQYVRGIVNQLEWLKQSE